MGRYITFGYLESRLLIVIAIATITVIECNKIVYWKTFIEKNVEYKFA